MRKTRVFIWGSSVSRDTFDHFDPDEFDLLDSVTGQSALSAYTLPVSLTTPPEHDSEEFRRELRDDFLSSLRTSLASRTHDVDLLLIDLVDERHGVFLLPDGTVATRTDAFERAGGPSLLPQGSHFLPFGSPKHFEYWSDAVSTLGGLVRRTMPRAAVVLLDIQSPEDVPPHTGMVTGGSTTNAAYRPYVDAAMNAFGARTLSLIIQEADMADSRTPNDFRFHFPETVYLRAVEDLTGAPGRLLWNGAAQVDEPRKPRVQHDTTRPRSDAPRETLTSTFWRYSTAGGTIISERLRFLPGGIVWGLPPAEAKRFTHWRLAGGNLSMGTKQSPESSVFPVPQRFADHVGLEGISQVHALPGGEVFLESTEFDWESRPLPDDLTISVLGNEKDRHGWTIGNHSTGKPTIIGAGRADLSIGRYCTFGPNVRLQLVAPRVNGVSMYSFYRARSSWPHGRFHTPESKIGPISIGNDVRIERNVTIRPGVAVGDGAYIIEGAVVVDDVPPYAIMMGTPAQVVEYRFPPAQIKELQATRWWEWADAEVDAAIPTMAKGIDVFLRHAREQQKRT